MKDRFPDMVRISERTSEIRTHANGGSGRAGVKGQDERQSTAPLTPARPLREPARSFCLTAEEAVIHGAQLHLPWVGKAGGRLIQSPGSNPRERAFPQPVKPSPFKNPIFTTGYPGCSPRYFHCAPDERNYMQTPAVLRTPLARQEGKRRLRLDDNPLSGDECPESHSGEGEG